jgi:hypothetical protein|tara:strand:+ start:234 stop:353 length:120 start_codon:yes stop_codon:yes gene_type:complete
VIRAALSIFVVMLIRKAVSVRTGINPTDLRPMTPQISGA